MSLKGNEPLKVIRLEAIDKDAFCSFDELTKAQRVLEAILRKPGVTINTLILERGWCETTLDFANVLLRKGYIARMTYTISEWKFLRAVERLKDEVRTSP